MIPGAPRHQRTVQNEDAVLECIDNDPTLSIRQIARQLELTYGTVQRIIKDNGLHAYHYVRVHQLLPRDYPARLQYCQWLLARIGNNEEFLSNVLFTDECTFGRDGTFNTRNNHHYSENNPHLPMVVRHQERFSINIWAGIIGNTLVRMTVCLYSLTKCLILV